MYTSSLQKLPAWSKHHSRPQPLCTHALRCSNCSGYKAPQARRVGPFLGAWPVSGLLFLGLVPLFRVGLKRSQKDTGAMLRGTNSKQATHPIRSAQLVPIFGRDPRTFRPPLACRLRQMAVSKTNGRSSPRALSGIPFRKAEESSRVTSLWRCEPQICRKMCVCVNQSGYVKSIR